MVEIDGKKTFNLYDVKTASNWNWMKMFGRLKNRRPGTDDNYKMQLATYSLAIKEEFNPDIINMFLIWYKKDNSTIRQQPVSPDWTEKAIDYWTELNAIFEDCGESFEQDLTPEYWTGVPFKNEECSYCDFYNICPSTLAPKRSL